MDSPHGFDYIPLSPFTCAAGERHGPISFTVDQRSHTRHLGYLARLCSQPALTRRLESLQHTLLPFELWSMSRALSPKYKRLNEVLLLSAERRLTRLAGVNEILTGDAEIVSIRTVHGLCVASIRSRTRDEHGQPLLESLDTVLLLNASDRRAVRQAIQRSEHATCHVTGAATSVAAGVLDMRFEWPEATWKNNIHTDAYARALGFRGALIEGPALIDLLLVVEPPRNEWSAEVPCDLLLRWKHTAPVYRGLRFECFKEAAGPSGDKLYLLCGEPPEGPKWQQLAEIHRRDT